MPGGGSAQFSAVPLNLLGATGKDTADYIVTGSWSEKAATEAKKYCNVNVVYSGKAQGYTDCPQQGQALSFSPDPAYVYYCANETVNGWLRRRGRMGGADIHGPCYRRRC